MGLGIFVGMLADLREHDPEGAEAFAEDLAHVNSVLAAAGFWPHVEPEAGGCWSAQMHGYAGLHYLRRIAAHLALRGALPPPGDERAPDDPLIAAYYARALGAPRGLGRLFGRRSARQRLGFDHLVLHGDADGYYVPIDFVPVLTRGPGIELVGHTLGSSHRLRAECERLRDALGIPADLDAESDELWAACDAQGEGPGWRRYGVEAFTCVRLLEGARRSIARGALLVFA